MPALNMGKYRERQAEGYHYKATENQKTSHAWGVAYNGAAAPVANDEMQEQTTLRWEAKYGKTRTQLAAQTYTTRTDTSTMTTGAKIRLHRQKYNKYNGTGAVFTAVGSFA